LARGRAGNLGGRDDPSRSQRRSPEEEEGPITHPCEDVQGATKGKAG